MVILCKVLTVALQKIILNAATRKETYIFLAAVNDSMTQRRDYTETSRTPTEPFDHVLDANEELFFLFLRVCVVVAQVTDAVMRLKSTDSPARVYVTNMQGQYCAHS